MNKRMKERMNEWIHNKKDNGNKVLKKLYFPEDFLYAKNDYIYSFCKEGNYNANGPFSDLKWGPLYYYYHIGSYFCWQKGDWRDIKAVHDYGQLWGHRGRA